MANQVINYELNLKDHFNKTMLGAESNTRKLDGSMNKLGSTVNRVGGYLVGAFALSKVWDFTKSVVLSTAAMASFNNAVIASSRTEGEGRSNLIFLNTQVDRLGLNLMAAQNGYKTFAGSVMGTNIQGSKANRIFRQVSEASTVLGLSAEQTEGSFLALGQMISKGTVQAEELRGQLAERIPGAFQIGARAIGMTTKQLGDAMKDGLIKSDEFLVKFGDELEKTFGGKLGAATHSLTANLNRMGNEWGRLKVNIGNSQSGIITSTLNWTASILSNFNKIISTANKVDSAFKMAGVEGYTLMERFNDFGFGGSTNKFINDNFTGGKGRDAMLQRSLQSLYVDPSSRSSSEALGSQAGLLRLRSSFSKAFANKEIGKLEYQKGLALMEQALSEIKGNLTANDNTKLGKDSTQKPIGASIGSPIESSGTRPQNITINVETLGKIEKYYEAQNGGSPDAVMADWRKKLLEILNDANQMVNR